MYKSRSRRHNRGTYTDVSQPKGIKGHRLCQSTLNPSGTFTNVSRPQCPPHRLSGLGYICCCKEVHQSTTPVSYFFLLSEAYFRCIKRRANDARPVFCSHRRRSSPAVSNASESCSLCPLLEQLSRYTRRPLVMPADLIAGGVLPLYQTPVNHARCAHCWKKPPAESNAR